MIAAAAAGTGGFLGFRARGFAGVVGFDGAFREAVDVRLVVVLGALWAATAFGAAAFGFGAAAAFGFGAAAAFGFGAPAARGFDAAAAFGLAVVARFGVTAFGLADDGFGLGGAFACGVAAAFDAVRAVDVVRRFGAGVDDA